jgi:hypothetical protein
MVILELREAGWCALNDPPKIDYGDVECDCEQNFRYARRKQVRNDQNLLKILRRGL